MVEAANDDFSRTRDSADTLAGSAPSLNLLDLGSSDYYGSRSGTKADDLSRIPGAAGSASLSFSDPFESIYGKKGEDLPVLGEDSHYGIDALTGKVTAYPNMHLDIWTKADKDRADALDKRGYSYALDPVSGKVGPVPNGPRTDIWTKQDADRQKILQDRGWSYGLNPSTGKVVRYPYGPQLD